MRPDVLIVDFGSQTTQLIARRVREFGVYAEVIPHTADVAGLVEKHGVRALILSGGPSSVYDEEAPRIPPQVFDLGIPILGICYGMQLMVHTLFGEVAPSEKREFGPQLLRVEDDQTLLFSPLQSSLLTSFRNDPDNVMWMSHGDAVTRLPRGFSSYARSDNTENAAIGHEKLGFYGVQFHPEVVHSVRGREVLYNFLEYGAKLEPNYTPESFIEYAVDKVKNQVGEGRVLCALSGGVDSLVAARLVHMAVGDRLTCMMVDNGLLRLGEADEVASACHSVGIRLVVVDAVDTFVSQLAGKNDPEERRKIIGTEFIRTFEREASAITKLDGGLSFDFLVQGTIYPDVIESVPVAGRAPIKSHHNVGGLPERMHMKLVEPIRELFKDEVRKVGLKLGLPARLLSRQPFPGPGLAVRCLGDITPERLTTLRLADSIVTEEIGKDPIAATLWQYFAVLLPVKTVGVQGDFRTFDEMCLLRAVQSEDAMTANWARLPYDLLDRIATRITNEVQGVNRVVFDITNKPASTIEMI